MVQFEQKQTKAMKEKFELLASFPSLPSVQQITGCS